MRRKLVREQILSAAKPALAGGESIRGVAAVWATEVPGRLPMLLRARTLHYLALTDQRLMVFSRPHRREPLTSANLVISKRHDHFDLERVRRLRPMLQVQVSAPGKRLLAFEFRPRDRSVGDDLARLLSRAARTTRAATP